MKINIVEADRMIRKLEEIEKSLAKLGDAVKTMRLERDSARNAASSLRKQLDERELELLQLDEEIQNATKKYEEELATLREDRKTMEKKLDSFGGRIRELISLLPNNEEKRNASSGDQKNKNS